MRETVTAAVRELGQLATRQPGQRTIERRGIQQSCRSIEEVVPSGGRSDSPVGEEAGELSVVALGQP